jgi:3',5'-cyclic AMP phosphodiesterase CpdA
VTSAIRGLAALLLLLPFSSASAGSLALLADLNGRYGSAHYHQRVAEAVAAIIEQRPRAVIIAGDMIAGQADPPLEPAAIDAMWDGFDRTVYQPLAQAGIEVLPVPGNHDASIYPPFALERQAYDRYWSARRPATALATGSSYPFHYALELPGFTFLGLDVTAPGELGPQQRELLEARRRDAAARGIPLLVASHLPLHPISRGRERETFSLPGGTRAGEVWVSGHHHAYYAATGPGRALHIALPPLGGNARSWLGSDLRSPFGYVALDAENAPTLYAWPGYAATQPPAWPCRLGALSGLISNTQTACVTSANRWASGP